MVRQEDKVHRGAEDRVLWVHVCAQLTMDGESTDTLQRGGNRCRQVSTHATPVLTWRDRGTLPDRHQVLCGEA